ncbi:hypothetical protein T4D_10634 [Trichinella pseudospiralis]|uniref:Secreted protein n=1 Tax=Trichinella pseudospiralis TaxID=6337 RepID=A0A0V1FZA9_TRIPS|nr:hypothetical protein T4D_10634 [Trichinella pseudospiralis]
MMMIIQLLVASWLETGVRVFEGVFCTTPSVEKPIALCRLLAGHLQSSQLFSSQSRRQFKPIERRSCACMQYAILK